MENNIVQFAKNDIIKKDIDISSFEVKQENDKKTVEGYITTFGNKDVVDDIISKGAFGKSFKTNKVKFLYQHDWKEVIGIFEELKEDDYGIYAKAVFANTPRGQEAYELLKMGALDSFSIGFRINKFKYEQDGSRVIEKASLMEASLVTFPANEMAQVTAVKGLSEDGRIEKRDFEEMLKHFGFSQKEACIIVSKSYADLESHWDNGCGAEEKDNQSDFDLKQIVSLMDNFLNELKGK
jgi:uncharacterized protein